MNDLQTRALNGISNTARTRVFRHTATIIGPFSANLRRNYCKVVLQRLAADRGFPQSIIPLAATNRLRDLSGQRDEKYSWHPARHTRTETVGEANCPRRA